MTTTEFDDAALSAQSLEAPEPSPVEVDTEQLPALVGAVTRNRFIAMLGGALFGAVTQTILKTSPAYAHSCSSSSVWPCAGLPRCNCCSCCSCCSHNCAARYGACDTAPPGQNWWISCNGCYCYYCADFTSHGCGNCICRFYAYYNC